MQVEYTEMKKRSEVEQEDLLMLLDEVTSARKQDKVRMRSAGLDVSDDEGEAASDAKADVEEALEATADERPVVEEEPVSEPAAAAETPREPLVESAPATDVDSPKITEDNERPASETPNAEPSATPPSGRAKKGKKGKGGRA